MFEVSRIFFVFSIAWLHVLLMMVDSQTTTPIPSPSTTAGPATANQSTPVPTSNSNASLTEMDLYRKATCPFAKWATESDTRNCFECRWCPFRRKTCCEVQDEIDILKALNLSGSDNWDCFITVAHFQECGKCAPESHDYLQVKPLSYAYHKWGWSVRVCKEACGYIYKQCKDAYLYNGDDKTQTLMIPKGMSQDEFCKDSPEAGNLDLPCYNNALGLIPKIGMIIFSLLMIIVMV
eukprot:PhF_6_TR6272/c0_g1_i1/m.9491